MRICLCAAFLAASLTAPLSPVKAGDQITFVSAHIPPFSIRDGERPGFFREIAAELARRVGIEMKVEYARSHPAAVKIVHARPNTVIFPLARTQSREPNFLWIQKVREVPVLFVSAQGKPKIETIDQAKKLGAVGVRRGFAVKDLKKRGLENLVVVNTPEENAKALAAAKIDAWYAPEAEILYTWTKSGQTMPLIRGFSTWTIHGHFAASKASPSIDVEAWRAAFKAMEREGLIEKIVGSYLKR